MAIISFEEFSGGKPVQEVSNPEVGVQGPSLQVSGQVLGVGQISPIDFTESIIGKAKELGSKDSYLYKGGQEVKREVMEAGQRVAEEPSPLGKISEVGMGLAGVTAETLKTAFEPIGMAIKKGTDVLSDIKGVQKFASNEAVGQGLDALTNIVGSIFQNWTDFKEKNPRLAQGIADNSEILLSVIGEKPAETALRGAGQTLKAGVESSTKFMSGLADDILKGTVKYGDDLLKKTKGLVDDTKLSLFGREAKLNSIDDVLKQAEKSLSPREILGTTETATAKPSLVEKWVGIPNDLKNRIAGKKDLLKEYFDVAHARNNFDTLPTVMEYATKYTDDAVNKMESILNETGSKIGQFRKKIGTYEANIDQVKKIEDSFSGELSKLNLEIKNGKVVQKPGTIKRVGSDRDISVLDEIYGEMNTVKENPSLEKLIDLRNIFDKKINFEKSSRDISNSLDSLSRKVRADIATESANIVGKTEAANLTKYSEFMDAFGELKSFTDRRAGGEYLLRLVLSGRGGEARRLIQTIKEYTGIDLMDHAVMSTLATDLIGNSSQKNLFRQEISKAGLDAYAAVTGDPSGILNFLNNIAKKGLINEEQVYLNAAKSSINTTNPTNIKPSAGESANSIKSSISSPIPKTLPQSEIKVNMKKGSFNPSEMMDDLFEKAKKYKSADEFVKAQGIPIFHGSNEKIRVFSPKKGSQGVIWFTDNPKAITAGESGAVGTKFINERITTGKNFAGWNEYEKLGLGQIKDMGFDGIKLPTKMQNGTPYNDYILFDNKTIKTKSQLTDIWNKANQLTPEQSLIQDAKKYKSADEFIKAQGTPVYHGTTEKFDNFSLEQVGKSTDSGMFGKGIYFTDDLKEATTYSKRGGKIGEVKEVLLDLKNPYIIKTKADIPKIDVPTKTIEQMKIADKEYSRLFTEKLQKEGYDGVIDMITPGKNQYVVFDPSQIKTKSQLTDIWNKANSLNINNFSPEVQRILNLK